MGFPRQEFWSGFPFPSPGDLTNPGIKPRLLHWQVDSLPLSHLIEESKSFDKCFELDSVQFSRSVVSDSLRPHELQHARPSCPSPMPGIHWTHVHQVGDAIRAPHPLFPLLLLPPIPPSIRVFFNESNLCMRWPKYWHFRFPISPSKEPPGRISFRMDWLDLLAVQGTLKSLLQHHSSKA